MFHFEKLKRNVNAYNDLPLDSGNNRTLTLDTDGVTAYVLTRGVDGWEVTDTFERELYFKGGHWSDIDIDRACWGPY